MDRLKKLKKGKQSVVKLDEYSNLLGERFQRKEVAWAKQRDTQGTTHSHIFMQYSCNIHAILCNIYAIFMQFSHKCAYTSPNSHCLTLV